MSPELRTVRLPSGEAIETPLLVPSFSSRGFAQVPGAPPRSEASELLEFFGPELHESFLVSAYDLHHKLLTDGDLVERGEWGQSLLARPKVLFIDSGGYEIAPGADAGELLQDAREGRRPWDETTYAALLDRIPEQAGNCALVSFDRPGETYESQIAAAQALLAARRGAIPVMLLKPPNGRHHEFRDLESSARRLGFCSIVGVTEHELGTTLVERIAALADLRDLLTRHRLSLPIHVFGALDPLFVPLYFAAGGDIFDGLTWLRYAYWHGLAIHHAQGPLLEGVLEQHDDVRRRTVAAKNLSDLAQLRLRLMRFVAEDGDWKIFNDVKVGVDGERASDILRDTYLSAMARRRG
jgi:hypothetical protein